jgi:hypothetical protein
MMCTKEAAMYEDDDRRIWHEVYDLEADALIGAQRAIDDEVRATGFTEHNAALRLVLRDIYTRELRIRKENLKQLV